MRTRGKNILVAALAMTAVFLLLRFGHRKVRYLPIFRGKGKSFGARLLDVVYYGVTILLAVLAGILALYLLGDWLLLGLPAILLAGIVWASKATLPKFFEQTKLMLNLGSAREGERVIYAGVPWEIKEIGIFSDLVNPALEGGHVRVPLRDLVPLVSRHFGKREPFFPTATGNWVILADATLGKVIRQTPECVQLVLLGSTIKTYTVDDFLGQMPRNLSLGFRLSVTFGLDYSHQKIATTGVPAILLDRVQSGLPRLVGEQNIVNIGVEFANAGASSLDYVVQADFTGDVAEKYFQIERAIQRICVETCNESGWVIPFTQVTMHYANPTESPSFILKEDAGS